MDVIQPVLTAIGSYGFPIVACGALFWMINKALKELTAAVNNNTAAINLFTERMRVNHDESGN